MIARPLKILAYSSLFPNIAQPRHGIFLEHRLAHLSCLPGVQVRVVAPVPWFPSSRPIFGRYTVFAGVPRQDTRCGLDVSYPRYPVVPRIGMAATPMLMAAATFRRLLQIRRSGFDFDVIDSYYLYPDGVAAMILGRWLGRPVLMTAFGTDVSLVPRHLLPRAQILWATRRCAGVTAVCQALKDELVRLGVPDIQARVILHGVDLDLFRPPADREALRLALGFDRPTLISVGHLIPRKGHHIAIEAMASLPDLQLLIVGDGAQEESLRCLARTWRVEERVCFLGHVDQRKLPELIGAADALLLCSDREGIANVLMEAMACGTPVAATAVWGSPEIVDKPEAGVLLRDRSPAAVAEGVRALLASPPDRSATRRLAERFSWSETAMQHLSLVRQVVPG
jgi:glycosyltransferase involved in cell wall biosynthesis